MEFLLVASIGAIACGFFQIAYPEHPNNINEILIYVGIIGLVIWLFLLGFGGTIHEPYGEKFF
jgi:hypothetical protein